MSAYDMSACTRRSCAPFSRIVPVLALLAASWVPATRAATTPTFSNAAPITILDNAPASLYPSVINVSGVTGNVITKATVVLTGVSHTFPDDIDILLVAPDGTRSILMSDAGGNGSHALVGATLTFSSTGAARVPNDTAIATATTYRPANYVAADPSGDADVFPSTGPGTVRNEPADFDVFNGINPNGDWNLYVFDDQDGDIGTIAGGWQLVLTVPAIFTVTKPIDPGDGTCDASCSLRDAIATAGDGDLIRFSPLFDSVQTITLGGTALDIVTSLTIQGPGADKLSVSGANASTVLTTAFGTNASLRGLTIRDGSALLDGGGIYATGSLSLRDVAVTGNRAPGYAAGVLLLSGANNFSGCTFSDNASGEFGAAVFVPANGDTSLRLVNSTISGNRSDLAGAIGALSDGTATFDLEIVNSTIAGNSSPEGGGLVFVTQNGAGASIAAALRNTILANDAPNVVKLTLGGGPIAVQSRGFSLSSENGLADLTQFTDKTGVDPRLGPLNNNGGRVETRALLAGSPALDAGDATGYSLDQRGIPRPYDIPTLAGPPDGDQADMGAVEMHAIIVTNAGDSGAGSLRQALLDANGNGVTQDDIVFAEPFFATARTINLAGALPDMTGSLSVNGPGAKLLTVRRDTGGDYRIFNVGGGGEFALTGLTISNGRAPDFGGGLFSQSRASLAQVAFTGNDAGFYGGGLAIAFADATVKDSTFSGNSAGSAGGGILFQGPNRTLRVSGTTLSANDATLGGGGLEDTTENGAPSRVEIVDSTIVGNSAPSGGGVEAFSLTTSDSDATITLRNSIVAGNTLPNLAASANCAGCSAAVVSLGHNLSNDPTNAVLDQPSDKFNTSPLLGPLADNGGPTRTHALLPGSPALDAGDWSGFANDQRRVARPNDQAGIANAAGGDGSDIGAVEDDTLFRSGFE